VVSSGSTAQGQCRAIWTRCLCTRTRTTGVIEIDGLEASQPSCICDRCSSRTRTCQLSRDRQHRASIDRHLRPVGFYTRTLRTHTCRWLEDRRTGQYSRCSSALRCSMRTHARTHARAGVGSEIDGTEIDEMRHNLRYVGSPHARTHARLPVGRETDADTSALPVVPHAHDTTTPGWSGISNRYVCICDSWFHLPPAYGLRIKRI
jgi:hypothetical protein